jgi:hypothetical protein
MEYCGRCGAQVSADQAFCHKCGAPLDAQHAPRHDTPTETHVATYTASTMPSTLTPPMSGDPANAPFLSAPLDTFAPATRGATKRGWTRGAWGFAGIVGVLLVLLVVLLVVAANAGGGNSARTSTAGSGDSATSIPAVGDATTATDIPVPTATDIPAPTDSPTPSASDWAQGASGDTYADVRDHPDLHQGDKVVWRCKINKFLGADPNDSSATDISCGGFDDGFSEAILDVPASIDTSAMHAGDAVVAYGAVAQPFQGTNGFGATLTDPQLTLAYLEDATVTDQATSVAQQTADALAQPTVDAASTATSEAADAQATATSAAQQTADAQSQADADASATALSQNADATAQAGDAQATATEAAYEGTPLPTTTPVSHSSSSTVSLSSFRLPPSVAGPSHYFAGEGGGGSTPPADNYFPGQDKTKVGVYQYGVTPKIRSAAGFVQGTYEITIYKTVDSARRANMHARDTARDDSTALTPLPIARVGVVADNEWLRGWSATKGGTLYCAASGGVRYKNIRAFALIQNFKSVTPSGYLPCTTEDRWVTRAVLKALYPKLVAYVAAHHAQ